MKKRRGRIEETDVDEIRDVIGADACAALVTKFGGKRLYVPQRLGAHAPITVVIGETAAAALVERFAGEYLTLPATARKQHCILEDLRAGLRPVDVARKYWVSDRYVRYLKAQAAEPAQQMDLF